MAKLLNFLHKPDKKQVFFPENSMILIMDWNLENHSEKTLSKIITFRKNTYVIQPDQ